MSYARTWSMAEPYVLRQQTDEGAITEPNAHPARPCSCRWKRLRTGLAR